MRGNVKKLKPYPLPRPGSIMEWYHKKKAIEDAGMKYVHAIEAYLTTTLVEKNRDNYHRVLVAKNYDGFLELNKLVSQSFNRTDNHFYYVPRISFAELFSTSDNILITTACAGRVLGKVTARARSPSRSPHSQQTQMPPDNRPSHRRKAASVFGKLL